MLEQMVDRAALPPRWRGLTACMGKEWSNWKASPALAGIDLGALD